MTAKVVVERAAATLSRAHAHPRSASLILELRRRSMAESTAGAPWRDIDGASAAAALAIGGCGGGGSRMI